MNLNNTKRSNPFLQVISLGIELWIRGNCNSIESIKIKLLATLSEAWGGKLSGINLKAKEVDFNSIYIQNLYLLTGPINLNTNLFNKSKGIILSKNFSIEGELTLSEKNLIDTINAPKWKWIKEWLSKNLIQGESFIYCKFSEQGLIIVSESIDNKLKTEHKISIEVANNTLCLKNSTQSNNNFLPMDPSIKITDMKLKNNTLLLLFNSLVNL